MNASLGTPWMEIQSEPVQQLDSGLEENLVVFVSVSAMLTYASYHKLEKKEECVSSNDHYLQKFPDLQNPL